MTKKQRMFLSTATKRDDVYTEVQMSRLFCISPYYDSWHGDHGLYGDNEEYIQERVEVQVYEQRGWTQHRNAGWLKNCPDCGGDANVTCPKCDGLGAVTDDDGYAADCPDCESGGYVACETCQNSGMVAVTDEDEENARNSEAWERITTEIERDLYNCWRNAAHPVFENYMGRMALQLVEIEIIGRGPNELQSQLGFIVKPADGKTWQDAALKFMDLIGGTSCASFDTPAEFLAYGPYVSYKEAVLDNLTAMPTYSAVYSDSAVRDYERGLQESMRNW